jgi:hypothetical protein
VPDSVELSITVMALLSMGPLVTAEAGHVETAATKQFELGTSTPSIKARVNVVRAAPNTRLDRWITESQRSNR